MKLRQIFTAVNARGSGQMAKTTSLSRRRILHSRARLSGRHGMQRQTVPARDWQPWPGSRGGARSASDEQPTSQHAREATPQDGNHESPWARLKRSRGRRGTREKRRGALGNGMNVG